VAPRSRTLRLATRRSPLALLQVDIVAAALAAASSGSVTVQPIPLETQADRDTSLPIHSLGGRGVFVTDVEEAVLDGRADAAVHSAKDVPSAAGLTSLEIAAVLRRGDPRDCLVGEPLASLRPGAPVATGSVRRRAQLAWLRPDLTFAELRGNLGTRLAKVPEGGAIVTACAALFRMGLMGRASHVFTTTEMMPQVGQGAIVVACRPGDEEVRGLVAAIEDAASATALSAERAFLAAVGGGCDAPVGAYAKVDMESGTLEIEAMIASYDGHVLVRSRSAGAPADAEALGAALARELLEERGGSLLLEPPLPGRPATGPAPAPRPLEGWRVAVTRPHRQAGVLASALRRAGAVPVEVPTIAIADPEDGGSALRGALADLTAGAYAWVVFTSENTVERVFAELPGARRLAGVRVAAIGDGTAARLAAHGVVADLVPGRFVAEALADAFPEAPAGAPVEAPAGAPVETGGSGSGPRSQRRVLLPRAAVARDVLETALRSKGWAVDVVTAYRTVHPELGAGVLDEVASLDAVTFTSSSTVTGWVELVGLERLPPVVSCIGPITSDTARLAGMDVTVEASPHSIPGLVAALEAYAAGSARP
jgi:hydroxymethylbilane synthase